MKKEVFIKSLPAPKKESYEVAPTPKTWVSKTFFLPPISLILGLGDTSEKYEIAISRHQWTLSLSFNPACPYYKFQASISQVQAHILWFEIEVCIEKKQACDKVERSMRRQFYDVRFEIESLEGQAIWNINDAACLAPLKIKYLKPRTLRCLPYSPPLLTWPTWSAAYCLPLLSTTLHLTIFLTFKSTPCYNDLPPSTLCRPREVQ